ncbi:MAG: hypothetical protein ABFD97_02290 [Syntrophobacter sp.]
MKNDLLFTIDARPFTTQAARGWTEAVYQKHASPGKVQVFPSAWGRNGNEDSETVYWREKDGMRLGHPESYPNHMIRGETLEELKENIKDIIGILKDTPRVLSHEDMAV